MLSSWQYCSFPDFLDHLLYVYECLAVNLNPLLQLPFLSSMFGVQISLAFLCALQLSVFAQALSIEKPSPLSITQAQDLSRPNASAIFSTTG